MRSSALPYPPHSVGFDVKKAYSAILLFGMISLLGDIVYEGGRGIMPGYLTALGASALTIGAVMGAGDLLGYGLRLFSGRVVDVKGWHWKFLFSGYGLIAAIPFLAFAGLWQVAAFFIVLERVGKALRAPPRDAVLSFVSKGVGVGKAFGLHEALDQIGAVAGPAFMAAILLSAVGDYRMAFVSLFLPYGLLLLLLHRAYVKVGGVETKAFKRDVKLALPRSFNLYILSVVLNVLGLIPIALILHKADLVLRPIGMLWIVPLLYTIAQLATIPSTLASGFLYDKAGVTFLAIPFALSTIPSALALLSCSFEGLLVACAFFGFVLGMQGSIYRAAVSAFVSEDVRGTAYGVFNAAYGVGLLAGGITFGALMDLRAPFHLVMAYIITLELAAIASLLKSMRACKSSQ